MYIVNVLITCSYDNVMNIAVIVMIVIVTCTQYNVINIAVVVAINYNGGLSHVEDILYVCWRAVYP